VKITTKPSYNFDLLCLLNPMTGDEFYLGDNGYSHKAEYDKFFPHLSSDIKQGIANMAKERERTMLWPWVTLLISTLGDFDKKDLCEMLADYEGIKYGLINSPYWDDNEEELKMHFRHFREVVVPFVKEMEALGFEQYWRKEKLPLLENRCAELNEFLSKYDISDEVAKLIPLDGGDVTMFVCAFARPHGAKLCGYNMISDFKWSNEDILGTVTHELFHPPYNIDVVRDAVDKLGAIPWVIDAYENQVKGHEYRPMDGFIEENIVEALGVFVLKKMLPDYDAYKYFKEHDYGSHVISPHFFDYLQANQKNAEQSMEDYFINFVRSVADGLED